MINGISRSLMIISVLSLLIGTAFAPILKTSASLSNIQTDPVTMKDQPHSLQVIEISFEQIILELKANKPQFELILAGDQLCEIVSIADLTQTEEPGIPSLPVQGVMLGIPQDSQPTIQMLAAESTSLNGIHDLCPSPRPIFTHEGQKPRQLEGYSYEREDFYQINDFMPSAAAVVVSTGYIRSQRFAQIRFNPIQYNPITGEVLYYSRIQIGVNFNSKNTQPNNTEQAKRLLGNNSEAYFENSLRDTLINYEQARAWRSKSSASAQSANVTAPESQSTYKILVNEDGIYQVSYEDLLAAGLTSEELDGINPQTFQLYNQADEVAIYVEGELDNSFDPGEYILFYGQKVNTKYTETNVYWLSWGNTIGLRMASLVPPVDPTSVPSEYLTTQHAEIDKEYDFEEISGPNLDHWYWGMVYAWNASASLDFTTTLQHISPISHTITVRGLIKGYTAYPNHHTKIYLNDNLIDDHSFPTGTEYYFSIPNVQLSYLEEITNTLRVECPRDGSITRDAVLFNWFEIDYYDTFYAENDRLFFDGDQAGNWEFQVDGFSSESLEAYDITNPLSPMRITNTEVLTTTNGHLLDFKVGILDEHRYLAQASALRLSASIIKDNPSNLKSTSNEADYIIISHSDFITNVQPLANFRISQGLRVKVIDVQDVYDEFNGGVFNPEAIKSFLAYAYDNWVEPAPSFVLLVGDGNYDFKNNTGWNNNTYIPPYLAYVDPSFGETATDNQYVTVSGDDSLPDMFIGRFPVQSVVQAQNMVEKTLNYEQIEPSGGWNAKQLFVADNKDSAGDFPVLSNNIINTYVPSAYTVDKIYYGIDPYKDPIVARNAIKSAINEGRLIVHYAGHGDIQYWASESLFRLADLAALTNGSKLPFMLPFTCMEGYFAYPSPPGSNYSSLAESIVRRSGGGAIASFSPTGWGSSKGHDMLDQSIFSDLFRFHQTQLGYLTTHAKYKLFANGLGYYYLIDTYILFGDPALRLQVLPVPNAPSNLVATVVSQTQIDLSWNDNSGNETGFVIERSLDNISWSQIDQVGSDVTSYADMGLTAGTTYYYRVRATSNNGNSDSSNIASETTLPLPPPETPSNLIATPMLPWQINLTWIDNSSDESGFQIERSPNGSSNWQQIAQVNAGVTSYSDTGLSCETTYYYRVRAYREGDGQVSDYSNVASATTYDCSRVFLPIVVSGS